MFEELYDLVCELIGTVPIQLEFIYGICSIILFCFVIFCFIFPFYMLYKIWS